MKNIKYKSVHKLSSCIESNSVNELLENISIELDEVVTVVCLNGDATKVFIKFENKDEVRSIGLDAFNLMFREVN